MSRSGPNVRQDMRINGLGSEASTQTPLERRSKGWLTILIGDAVPTGGGNLGSWAAEMSSLLSRFMRNSEGEFGYPPG